VTASPPPNNSPINRAALDKIIQRAAELQTGEREIGDNLTPDEVLALGKEVGIPTKYLQQAMLEHRTSVETTTEPGLVGRLVGPDDVRADRVVQGDPEDAIRGLLSWMERNELLVVQRQQPGWVSWEPLKGMQAAIRRGTAALDTSKPKFMLSRSEVVVATVSPLEGGFSHVSLTATLKGARREYLLGASVSAGVGIATGGLLLTAGLLGLALAPVGLAAVVSAAVVRSYRPVPARVQLGLERALDYLERGGVKAAHEQIGRGPGLLDVIAGEIRRVIVSGQETRRDNSAQRRLPDQTK
jgi:hypothetical protein